MLPGIGKMEIGVCGADISTEGVIWVVCWCDIIVETDVGAGIKNGSFCVTFPEDEIGVCAADISVDTTIWAVCCWGFIVETEVGVCIKKGSFCVSFSKDVLGIGDCVPGDGLLGVSGIT